MCERCHKCKAGTTKIVVSYDGSVLPCEAFKGKKELFVLGNVNKGDSLEGCLERAKTHKLLNFLKKMAGVELPEEAKSLEYSKEEIGFYRSLIKP